MDQVELKNLIAKHYFVPVFGCECMPTNKDGTTERLDVSWEEHLAQIILEAFGG